MPQRETKVPCCSAENPLAEGPFWSAQGQWRQLAGSFYGCGFSFEWHELTVLHAIDWSQSFHPGSVELCLNLEGKAQILSRGGPADYSDMTAGFYCQMNTPLRAVRFPGRHRFLTLELSREFLSREINGEAANLPVLIQGVLAGNPESSGAVGTTPLTTRQNELVLNLCRPPVSAVAQPLWYRSKALEIIAETLLPREEMFCSRQKRVARERMERVVQVLRQDLAEAPSLEELGRKVGCSPFYLSRTFTQEMGMTISQFLRQARMEKAAELLASGKFNVTEAAMEVGYSSLSHFSQAFCQTIGCCPNLYPQAKNLAKR